MKQPKGVLPMHSLPDDRFPSCPCCPKGRGLARALALGHHVRTITYVCDSCEHTWTTSDEAPQDHLLMTETGLAFY
jgi:hypothetical protein